MKMTIAYSLLIVLWLVTGWTDVDAAQKKTRRIIVNDDGEVKLPRGKVKDWGRYVGKRLHHAVRTQMDSYFLNIAATDRGPGIVHSL